MSHEHSFTCLEEVGGHLVCRTQAKQLTVKDLPAGSSAAHALSLPAPRRPSLLNPRKQKKISTGHSSLDEPRVRFNWGYHDGANDAKAGRQPMWTAPHHDPVYEAGYRKGRSHVEVSDTYTGDSSQAWEQYTEGRTILTHKGSIATTFHIKPARYEARGENYESLVAAYWAWMDKVGAGVYPRDARTQVETDTGQYLVALSPRLMSDLDKAIASAPDNVRLLLISESPTGKTTQQRHEVKGVRRP
jgi:hypothetical protein